MTEVDSRGVLVELTGKHSKKSIFSSCLFFLSFFKLFFCDSMLICSEAPKVVAMNCVMFSQPKILRLPEEALNAYLEMFSDEIHKIIRMFEEKRKRVEERKFNLENLKLLSMSNQIIYLLLLFLVLFV